MPRPGEAEPLDTHLRKIRVSTLLHNTKHIPQQVRQMSIS